MLKLFFEKYNYKVGTVYSGEEAISRLNNKSNAFDIIILDLHMPGICGIETCKQIRTFSEIPILVLTSCSEDIQTVLALEIGADDYMTKPFEAMTLLARIKAIMRRSHKQNISTICQARYSFSKCILDTATQTLSFNRKTVLLTTGVYKILKYFIDNPNIVLSRERLMESIKDRSLESYDRSIDIQVSRLRKILDDCDIKNAIKTVHGSGYMWSILVTKT